MRRRTVLGASGIALGYSLGPPSPLAAARGEDEEPDEDDEPAPIEFAGEGVAVTDTFGVEGGATIVEAAHDGESTFFVQAVPEDDGESYPFIYQTGEFDGAGGGLLEEGNYSLYVDADGAWELIVRQPRVPEADADTPPLSAESDGSDWIGPVYFDGDVRAAGRHDGEWQFTVEVVPQEGDVGELAFRSSGPFGGITSLRTEGVGYVVVDADGEWQLELE